MGTRNLTMVELDGEFKIAQYGQWDGYPEGNGLRILQWLRKFCGEYQYLKSVMRNVTKATDEEVIETWTKCGAPEDGDGFVSIEVADKHTKAYPQFSRDTGVGILDMVMAMQGKLPVKRQVEFAADSLFCEWAYVIDLDQGTFVVCKGYNRTPLDKQDRFYFLQNNTDDWEPKYDGDQRYYPIRAMVAWPLNALPSDEEFLAATKEEEAAEEEILPDPATEAEMVKQACENIKKIVEDK
jgi:hypothetical protein